MAIEITKTAGKNIHIVTNEHGAQLRCVKISGHMSEFRAPILRPLNAGIQYVDVLMPDNTYLSLHYSVLLIQGVAPIDAEDLFDKIVDLLELNV